jgi:fluoride ion exporter CrcB/FEX
VTFADLLAVRCLAAMVARHAAQSDLSTVPPGTLAANMLGGLLMGFAMTPSRTTGAASRSQVTRRNGMRP